MKLKKWVKNLNKLKVKGDIMAKRGRKPIEITEQDISDIMLLNSKGYMAHRIAEIIGKSGVIG